MHRVFVDSTRKADEVWLMCETVEDVDVIVDAVNELIELEALDGRPKSAGLQLCPTPTLNGRYTLIPYSLKINEALDMSNADAIVYLDNNSMPSDDKFELMLGALEEHEDWGAVYCTQKRTGFDSTVFLAEEPVDDAFCVLNYTQVMHRWTPDRWELDMRWADPDLADGLFWRALHKNLGSFYPVASTHPLDEHHIPSPKAVGV